LLLTFEKVSRDRISGSMTNIHFAWAPARVVRERTSTRIAVRGTPRS
jgi:hypothetical protein